MARSTTPKHCAVNMVKLDGKGNAFMSLSCSTSPGSFRTEYVHKKLRGIRAVRLDGATVSGAGTVGFVVSPRYAKCRRDGYELDCKIKGSK